MASNDEYQQQQMWRETDRQKYIREKWNELIDVILKQEESEVVEFTNHIEINNN